MPKLEPTELRPGVKIVLDNQLWVVIEYAHTKPGKGSPFVTCKLRNMIDGRVIERTFRGSADHPEQASVAQRNAQFLYSDDIGFHFMDLTTYEQFSLKEEIIGERAHFLLPEAEVLVLFWNDNPVGLDLPPKMVFTVTDTVEEVAKGNTSGSITKPATLETGLTINVPPFIKNGEKVLVNTETGEYVERA